MIEKKINMKKLSIYLSILILAFTAISSSSCKKGDDDPVVSFRTRKDRFTNTWTLTKYEKNGAAQDISGAKYIYDVRNDNTLKQTIQGSVFGFPTESVKDGTWAFVNDEEDVTITIEGSATTYNVQRLASDELWLKEVKGSDIHVYYFDGK
jgi:hypothetical protein